MVIQDDDGVTVTDYPEDDIEIHPKANYADEFVSSFFHRVGTHGWIILGTIIALIYIWTQYIRPNVNRWLREREERQSEAKHHKDPDAAKKEKEKIEQARLKMQKQYEENARIYQEKLKEKEALKRAEQEAAAEAAYLGDGQRLGNGSDDNSSKKSHKPVYNPLAGSSSLPSYRPPRRTACSRGNCG